MRLRNWRLENGLKLRELADLLGIGGKNPSRSAQRIETGSAPVDAPLADRILEVTSAKVTLEDIHAQRRDWLSSDPGASK